MSLVRIQPFIYFLTPLGEAEAHFLANSETFEVPITYGCFMLETKENWWWPNTQVRLCESVSALRSSAHSPIHLPDDLFEELKPHILRHKRSPFYERAKRESCI
jgi:hypothetical protein